MVVQGQQGDKCALNSDSGPFCPSGYLCIEPIMTPPPPGGNGTVYGICWPDGTAIPP
ncbi:hypothetical protein GYMLUDRAFT_576673 [Collybiopsis luxurians FD-317 M1]|uniref:Uncharacterized protein n=1 Tax=Collybiopsis luxurians FD-317 M1 TaxID=944289 RepID=A0A0D0C0Q3_9AGAR|nr:hypothetical protein GYMLUDRAFT_576673 [Collybiopsis luxurians FD-317 M1]